MKTKVTDGSVRVVIKLRPFGSYVDEIYHLESTLTQKPKRLQLDLVGCGKMSSDTALILRSVLLARAPETQLVTNARSSLSGAVVLIWLLGDLRLIRDDARLLFAAAGEFVEEKTEWKERLYTEEDPFEGADYVNVLRAINEYLPVAELADTLLTVPVLHELGLVDNEAMEKLLAEAGQSVEEVSVKQESAPEKNPTESSG